MLAFHANEIFFFKFFLVKLFFHVNPFVFNSNLVSAIFLGWIAYMLWLFLFLFRFSLWFILFVYWMIISFRFWLSIRRRFSWFLMEPNVGFWIFSMLMNKVLPFVHFNSSTIYVVVVIYFVLAYMLYLFLFLLLFGFLCDLFVLQLATYFMSVLA